MTTPYNHFKWLEDRFARIEKRLNEISKKQTELAKTQRDMRERALKLDESTLAILKMSNGIFTERCDGIEDVMLSLLDRVIGLEAKVLPDLHKDIHQLRKIIPLNSNSPNNPLDKRKPRKSR